MLAGRAAMLDGIGRPLAEGLEARRATARHRRRVVVAGGDTYDWRMSVDPLKSALEEIAPKLDPGLEPLFAALRTDEPVEEAWEALLQEILDEA
jgi:hypothetical protein